MPSKRMQELAAQKAKIEEAMIAERKAQLANIHEEYGYGSREDLIAALRGSGQSAPARKTAGKRGRKKRAVAAAAPKPAASRGRKRRKRTTITPELRKSIESAVRSGKTGAAVAAEFGVSLPTVQNIKRAAGLTRK